MENKEIISELLTLISDIAVDYDGYNSVESLKELIDEMAEYVRLARKLIDEPNDTYIMTVRKLLGKATDKEEIYDN